MNKYTTIRYHIFKELSKHREKQKARSSDRIREIAIPILSGIIVQLLIVRYKEYVLCIGWPYYFALLLFVVILFVSLTIIMKKILNWYDNTLVPNICPFRKYNSKISDEQLEEADARFNYEVTYLIESAYHMAKKLDFNDKYESRLTFHNTIFCLDNADEKIQKSLYVYEKRNKKAPGKRIISLGKSSINTKMIKVFFEVYNETINLLRNYTETDKELPIEEVNRLVLRYKTTKQRIINLMPNGIL